MGAPPRGVCHFPVKRDGRVVWCGEKCAIIDPNTGDFTMFCAEHQQDLEKHLAKLRQGESGYKARGKFKAKNVTMYK